MDNLRFRHALGVLIAIEIGLAILGAANAAVKISKKPTANMNCSGSVCTPTAEKAVLNVADLANMLAGADVTISSGGLAQDIEIDAALSWTSTSRLTLDAYPSIEFNKPVVIAGAGDLTIMTNDGGSGGDFRFFGKGHAEFWDLNSKLIINGHSYWLVNTLKTLAKAIRRDENAYYALAKNLNEKNRTYTHSPISSALGGLFEGLGNVISNLSIVDGTSGDDVALFSELLFNGVNTGLIRDVGLASVSIIGTPGQQNVAALVAHNRSGTIANSYVTGSITGGTQSSVGGLVGTNETGTLKDSFSTASVSGGSSSRIGGLVGYLWRACDGCPGTIDRSYATGGATGADNSSAGGLTGYSYGGDVTNSFATGAVSGGTDAFVGGLVGTNADNINSPTSPALFSSYSTGIIMGGSGATVGGVIGQDVADSQISNSYWDMDTSGVGNPAQGAGNVQNDPGITGLTTAQFTSGLPAGFSPSVWKEKANINRAYPYLIDNPPQ